MAKWTEAYDQWKGVTSHLRQWIGRVRSGWAEPDARGCWWVVRAEYLNDLLVFEPASMEWTKLSEPVAGHPPLPRSHMGMAASEDSVLVYGGWTGRGTRSVGYAYPGGACHV